MKSHLTFGPYRLRTLDGARETNEVPISAGRPEGPPVAAVRTGSQGFPCQAGRQEVSCSRSERVTKVI